MNVPSTSGAMLLKDRTYVDGDGWGTTVVENDTTALGSVLFLPIFGAYANTIIAPPASIGNTEISNDIHISNMHFLGVRSNAHDSGIQSTLAMFNVHTGSVRYCHFEGTGGYSVEIGGNGSNGFYAKDFWFEGNLCENLMSQNLAIITAENVYVNHNTFRNPGKAPFTITDASNASPIVVTTSEANHFYSGMSVTVSEVLGNTAANGTFTATKIDSTHFSLNGSVGNGAYISGGVVAGLTPAGSVIDIEPNGDPVHERMNNVHIIDNVIDFTEATVGMNGISYQITAGLPNRGCIISGNTVIGGGINGGLLYNGINTGTYSKDVIIDNNNINEASQSGLYVSGTRIRVNDNKLVNSGNGGSASIRLDGLVSSAIVDNEVLNPTAGSSTIYEFGTNDKNYIARNRLGGGEAVVADLSHQVGSTVTNSIYADNVVRGTNGGGISESASSNNNLFDGNTTRPVAGSNTGLTTVGAGTKVISHKYDNGQTLRQTLISPSITTPTGIVKSDVGLGNVDNTSDTTKNAAAATLTNKTVNLANNTVTGTTAQFNAALSDNDFATLAGAETLTNKTLTSPAISSPTGIVKADVGLGNVDNTSDATKNSAAVTLSNKTVAAPVLTGRTRKSTTNAITPGATPTLDASLGDVFTLTPAQNENISITNQASGQEITLIILTSGVTSFTITFGAGFKPNGTLATGTVSGKYFVVKFFSDGTNAYELSRTTAL
jgi:hypothetical protein